jgi:putative transposase
MARLPRIVIPGIPHHVTQRGNRRQRVFFSEDDYRLYLNLLAEWRALDDVAVLAYCLMPNHVHIIAVPSTEESLTHAVSEVHRRYSQAINRKKKWVGHLWQGRYSSFPMSEEHLFQAVQYVEQNPVKSSLVASPEDWKWSSAHEQSGKSEFSIVDHSMVRRFALSPHATPFKQEEFASHGKTGRPMGNDDFIKRLEVITGRDLLPKKAGRKAKILE